MQSTNEISSDLQELKDKKESGAETINSSGDMSNDDGFYLVEENNIYSEAIDFESYPWLEPSHPLYFPAIQASASQRTRWEAVDKFSVENWYPHLQKHTFKSHFLTLKFDDILYLMEKASSDYDSSKLEKTLDTILEEFNNKEAFMRLSTRSPKDSKYLFEEASSIMSKDLFYWSENDNKHQQLVSFVASMLKAMKIKEGRKIIESIRQSPRVFGDLIALVSTAEPSECTTKIILREWQDIRPDHEFRVFVSRRNRKESIVTAISPYFHFLYYDKTPADGFNFSEESCKNALVAKLENYVLKSVDPDVAKFLNFSSEQDEDNSSDCIREYIVDLALVPASQYHGEITDENKLMIGKNTYVIVVIELNPFAPSATGSALFNWKNDLMTLWGKAECEYPVFRHRTTPREDLHTVTLLPTNYESVIKSALSKRLANAPPEMGLISQRDQFFTPLKTMSETIVHSNTKDEKPNSNWTLSN
ncbi:hypothetical protein [Legionella brunensis]|uniref:Uncharacterized protein n=1 Tax=Legionella brunensis TaxID=29422 RepID=A0A0W0SUZ3_9GAMM|nr:hypothetical protein [Legionella brunensis]KTC87194.1 hypothetical protein Lbru_0012 [Legionella brunensis]